MSAPLFTAWGRIWSALEKAGVPGPSPWWRESVGTFYTHPSARLFVGCVGRGGDKSRESVGMALAETLGGTAFTIPPGERHYFAHVAENRDEAAKTLAILEQYLRILGVPFSRSGETIDLEELPRGFKVFACRVGAVSGFRCLGWTADEAAKWSNEGADPSAEVIASIKAMTVTHPGARGRMISSPLSTAGYFHETWAAGDTASNVTAHAASWEANPSITEARTRELEPHEPTWRREYAAIPGAGESGAFDGDDVARMVRPLNASSSALGAGAMFIDSSSGRGDGWSFGIAQYAIEPSSEPVDAMELRTVEDRWGRPQRLLCRVLDDKGRPIHNPKYREPREVLWLDSLGCFEGQFAKTTPFDAIVAHIAKIAKGYGIRRCFGDQYLAYSMTSEFARHGIKFVEKTWTQPTKIEAIAVARRLLREGALVVEPGPEATALQRELMATRERILPSGALTIVAKRTGAGHADRASLLTLIARCEAEGEIQGSPFERRGNGVTRYDPYTHTILEKTG